MRIRDLSIRAQMFACVAAVFVLMLAVGGVAWLQTSRMWDETQGMYEHPLAVRRALHELTDSVMTMAREYSRAARTEEGLERSRTLQSIAEHGASAEAQLGVLRDRYLGPAPDVTHIALAMSRWRDSSDEQLRQFGGSRYASRPERLRELPGEGLELSVLLGHIDDVGAFAAKRGDKFYSDARSHRDGLLRELAVVCVVVVAILALVAYLLLRAIRLPLDDLTAAADRYRRGDYQARTGFESANEFGALAKAFNALASTVEADVQRRDRAAHVADMMLRVDDLREFGGRLLQVLLDRTDSQTGALYVRSRDGSTFDHIVSIGLSTSARMTFPASGSVGEFGAALSSRRICRVSDIPEDTGFSFTTVVGDIRPREIVTIPIESDGEVVAVVSLSSIRAYSPAAAELIDDVWDMMTARFGGVLLLQQVRDASELLDRQNRELQAQKSELTAQAEELSEQNIELEMQKQQLDQASRLKTTFLSTMSHELRTPLNSVIALSGVLGRRLKGRIEDEDHEYLAVIERNGKQLLALINDILDLSRIEAGKEEVRLERFSIGDLVADIASTISPQASEKQVDVAVRVQGDLHDIVSDSAKCRHILQNIIGNAVKYTDVGVVGVEVTGDSSGVTITVTDTGVGISEERLPYIFDEFRQGDEGTSRRYGGSGLGLAIARRYLNMLHGSVVVESKPGKGSTFTVWLPGAPTQAYGRSADPAREERLAPAAGKRILLVEDSEPAIVQVREILEAEGCEVSIARSGQEAVDSVAKSPPDGMILDLMMPGMDGFEVLRTIRGAEATAVLPVLILTAKHVSADELSFLRGNHVHQLIQKGDVNRSGLLAAVRRMVSSGPISIARLATRRGDTGGHR